MANLNLGYKKVAGLDWPKTTPDYSAYLTIARFGRSPLYWRKQWGVRIESCSTELGSDDPGECMVKGVRKLIPCFLYDVNPWGDSILYECTNNVETVLIGSAGCGKSHSVGVWALMWWGLAPETTAVFLSSTSRAGLLRRVWGYLAELFAHLKKQGFPGVHSRQLTAIVNEDDERKGVTADSVRAGVIGVAVEKGNETEIAGKIRGAHHMYPFSSKYAGMGSVVQIADECDVMANAGAFYEAVSNLKAGCDVYRLVSMGNIRTRKMVNALSDRADPKRGWGAIDIDATTRWESRRGAVVLRFDALKSPGYGNPDRYGYLPTKASVAAVLAECHGNENDPKYLSMVRAFPSDAADLNCVFPHQLQERYKVLEDVEFAPPGQPLYSVMGIDPAFTAGGDRCAVCVGQVGYFREGVLGIRIAELVYLEIDGLSEIPVTYQLDAQIAPLVARHGIQYEDIAVDSTGTQTLADVLEENAGVYGVRRVSFSSRATSNPVSAQDPTPASQRYGDLRSEMWFRILEYARYGQIRNLPEEASIEFSTRQRAMKRLDCIESKTDMKKRMGGKSPDAADSVALMLYAACERGLLPGATTGRRGFRPGRRSSSGRGPGYLDTLPDYSEAEYDEEDLIEG